MPPVVTVDWAAAHAGAQVIAGKWVIPILAALTDGPRTHTDLHRAVGSGVSPKVLTETLRRMHDAGLLTRRTAPRSPAGPYTLTPAGRALRQPLDAIANWHRHTLTEHVTREDTASKPATNHSGSPPAAPRSP